MTFYESDEDGAPVQVVLDALDLRRRAKVLAMIRLRRPGAACSSCYTPPKRTAQTPEQDIALAEGRMQRYLRTEGDPT